MNNGIAVTSSQSNSISYNDSVIKPESSTLFSDILETVQLEADAAGINPTKADTGIDNTTETDTANNNGSGTDSSKKNTSTNNTGNTNSTNTGITGNSSTGYNGIAGGYSSPDHSTNYSFGYDYSQANNENATATALSNQGGLDTNTLLLCMMMGGGFGGLASALAMGAMLSDDSTLDTLRGLFGSSSLFQNSGSTAGALGSVGSGLAQAVAGALSVPTNAWEKSTPGVVSNENNRSAALYRQVIEQFDVENSGRYTVNKQGYGDTYCNIFMWDVTSAMGAEIPHFINSNTKAPTTSADPDAIEMTANSTYDWLHEYGAQYGWQKVDEQTAQAYANQGLPAVSIYKASGHGHAQIISPSTDGGYDATRGAAIAQAGRKLYDYAYTSNVYSQGTRQNKVAYFVHA